MHYHVGPVATASVPVQLQLLSPIASIRCLSCSQGWQGNLPTFSCLRVETRSHRCSTVRSSEMPGCTTLLGDKRCATVCTKPSIQMIFKIMLYQFIKNTSSNQPVVLRQPPPYFSPQIHLNKSFMTEKEKQRLVGGGSMSNRDVWDIFYYVK